ncbi:MAG TPA: response regulator transcription factor [Hyphomicrobiales bacterium]
MMGKRILIVDDEPQIRKFLRITLMAQGYDVVEAPRGEEGISKCATAQPNLVILDLGLPDLDGQQVIGRIREWSDVPIIVLSVRTKDQEKVSALDSGANDYVIKPFSIEELLARIRAALRVKLDPVAAAELVVGELVVDVPRHKVLVGGQEIKLTRKEFDLLLMLAQNAGRIVTHRQILRAVWGPAHEGDVHYLRIYIGHLRQKLGDDPANPKFIESEPGVGYRLILDAA